MIEQGVDYMKRCMVIFLSMALLLSLCACNKEENDILKNNKIHFSSVAEFALSYYSENKNSSDEHITLVFDNGDITDGEKVLDITNELSASIKTVADSDFDYLWVAENYVIFWKDETKYYGLLWSESATDIIKTMKNEWFSSIEHNKIDDDWYEIGVLSAI